MPKRELLKYKKILIFEFFFITIAVMKTNDLLSQGMSSESHSSVKIINILKNFLSQ